MVPAVSVVAGLCAGTETAAWPPPGTRPRHGAALGGGHRQHGARPRGQGHQGELVTVLLAREGLVLRNIGNANAELDTVVRNVCIGATTMRAPSPLDMDSE